MPRQIVITGDGSHTLINEQINEHYHSVNGAVAESMHVFIENGLNYRNTNPVNILEIGFGTGLNAFLAFREAEKQQRLITYDTIELYPIEENLTEELNYSSLLGNNMSAHFTAIHNTKWNKEVSLSNYFSLHKIAGDANLVKFPNQYNVVFFDAFSPEKQPELWTQQLFRKIFQAMRQNGVLTTYCSKGIVKRALKETGFTVQRIPGPPGKRHMVRALKE